MKYAWVLLLAIFASIDPASVKKINDAKAAAEAHFLKGNYAAAIEKYRLLIDSLGVREDEVYLNLANAYYMARDTANAYTTYQTVSASNQRDLRSNAQLQLGLLANQQGRPEEALGHFKDAIKADPSNDDARYNYEMVKKKLQEQKDQQDQQQQDEDQQNQENQEQQQQKDKQQQQDQKDQEQQDSEDQQESDQQNEQSDEQKEKEQKEQQENQEEQESEQSEQLPNIDQEKLKQMQISEEKARMILEAMKNQEKQYLQQQKRKAEQPRDPNKPDW